MTDMINIILPVFAASVLTGVATYIGFIHSLRIKVAVLESKVANLQKRVDSHSKKTDEILETISDFKQEVSNKLNEIAVDIAKLSTELRLEVEVKNNGRKSK
jgi:hypothetical protein